MSRRWNAPIAHRKGHSNTGHVGITDTVHRRGGVEFPRLVIHYRPRRGDHRSKTIYYGANGKTRAEALAEAVEFRRAHIAQRMKEEGRIAP